MNDEPDQKNTSRVSRDPLHGVTLETMLTKLVERHGWDGLAERIAVRCFMFEPSIKSSLAFLRKTPWARKKIEDWYAYDARRNMFKAEQDPTAKPTDKLGDTTDSENIDPIESGS